MIDVNEEVSGCHDRSGLGNDALERLPYSRPTFSRPAALGHAALRFEPVVRPDGNYPCRLGVADNRSLEFGTEDFAYVLVMNWSNDPKTVLSGTMPLYDGSGGILSKQNSIYPYAGVFLMANFPSYYVSPDATTPFAVQLSLAGPLAVSYSDGLNDEVFRVYTLRRKHTDLALRINATREGGVKLKSSVDVSGQGGDLLFGGVVGQPLRGEIAEIVALRGDFSDEQLVALERHLMSKYLLQ